MENIAKLKSYRSFRIPVKSSDKVYLNLVRYDGVGLSDEHIKWELQNVSLTGVAFQTSTKFELDSILEIELKYKRYHFEASAKIIRITPIFNEFSEIESYQYGVEFFTQDQENCRDFISHFISGFSTKRLKKHLINLLINESRINTFTDGQKLSLSMNLFTDMKQFKGMDNFLKMIFSECCRIANSEQGNIFILSKHRNKLFKMNLDDQSKTDFCNLEREDFMNEVLSKKRYKVVKSLGHLSLDTFPSSTISAEGVEFKHALYFPMTDTQGKVYGVFEFINFKSSKGYTDKDLGTIEMFSNIFTMCYEGLDKGEFVRHLVDDFDNRNKSQLIGDSEGIDKISEFIQSSKGDQSNILIEGNHGVGKIHVAKNIHEQSKSSNMSFGQIHCEGISTSSDLSLILLGDKEKVGRLELYSGGTILLHEPTFLSLDIQRQLNTELLKRSDIRIIATSIHSLNELVDSGEFDQGLFETISKNYFYVDDLKNRIEDIPLLINYFLDYYCSMYGLPSKRVCPKVMNVFSRYDWPGNVAELQRTIERFVNYYPYIRFLDELPQKEFPIIGHFARQISLFKNNRELVENLDMDLLKDKFIERYCSDHNLSRAEFFKKFPDDNKVGLDKDMAS
jgi:transcriptional regulator with GAF, ATPase, and Fis domain